MARGVETPPGWEFDTSISWVLPGHKLRLMGWLQGPGPWGQASPL